MEDTFVCPITYEVMRDPVMVDSGVTYERKAIEEWQKNGGTCPVTREPIRSFTPNRALKNAIDMWLESQEGGEGVQAEDAARSDASERMPVKSTADLAGFFRLVDPVRADLSLALTDWRPPLIVMIGNESSGKSTVLERLTMLPLFPINRNVCTRLPIEVRLRRGQAVAPTVQVVRRDGRVVERVRGIAAEEANTTVSELMSAAIRAECERGAPEFTNERRIVVRVVGPDYPDLDLLDLPGLVQYPEADRDASLAVVQANIREAKGRAVFLVTLKATQRLSESRALALANEEGIRDETIGVVTFLDACVAHSDEDDTFTSVSDLVSSWGRRNGLVCVMNRLPKVPSGAKLKNYSRLQVLAGNENAYFAKNGRSLNALTGKTAGTVWLGTNALVQLMEETFAAYIKETWVPRTLALLEERDAAITTDLEALGMPAAHTDDLAREAAPVVVSWFTQAIRTCQLVQHPRHALKHIQDVVQRIVRATTKDSCNIDELLDVRDAMKEECLRLLSADSLLTWCRGVASLATVRWQSQGILPERFEVFRAAATKRVQELVAEFVTVAFTEMRRVVEDAFADSRNDLVVSQGAEQIKTSGAALAMLLTAHCSRAILSLSRKLKQVDWQGLSVHVGIEACAAERVALLRLGGRVSTVVAALRRM